MSKVPLWSLCGARRYLKQHNTCKVTTSRANALRYYIDRHPCYCALVQTFVQRVNEEIFECFEAISEEAQTER